MSERAWMRVDAEAARGLRHLLAARKLLGFDGPHGWEHAAEPLGRTEVADPDPVDGVTAASRAVQPLIELRVPFELARSNLDTVDRGAPDPDLTAVLDAVRLAAAAEDHVLFHGYPAGEVPGMASSSPHDPLPIDDDYDRYPATVARAVATLRDACVEGPYAIALGPRCYTGVTETTEHGGYPVLEHLRLILGGPVVWAPAVDGAVVLSRRGGDYRLVVGQDLSIGYLAHTAESVTLYLEESLTLLIHDNRAAVALRHGA